MMMAMDTRTASGFDVVATSISSSRASPSGWEASSSLLRADSWEAEDAAQRWAQDLYYMNERSEQEYNTQYYEALTPLLQHAHQRQAALQAQEARDVSMYFQQPVMPLQSSALRANTFGMPRAGSGAKRTAPVEQAHAKRQRGDPLPDWLMDD